MTRPTRVLLLEDNPGDARLVRETLSHARGGQRFQLDHCERLADAIQKLQTSKYDVVLTDLLLPDSYGFDTLDRISAEAQGVPVVVLTSVDDEEFALEAVKRGAQDYLLKAHIDGLQGDVLVRTLRYAIDRHEAMRELDRHRERLIAIKAQLHDLLEFSTDGVVIVGEDGLVRFVNSAAEILLGRLSEDLQGDPFPYPLPDEDPVVLELPRADGRTMVAELRSARTEWDGEGVRFVTLRNVTDRSWGRGARGPKAQAVG